MRLLLLLIRTNMTRYAGFAALFLLLATAPFPGRLSAQVRINGIDWQVSRAAGGEKKLFEPIMEVKLEPYQRYPGKLRAMVSVQNPSARPAGGLVLRCALSLHLVRPGVPGDAGFWSVPFRVEEVRISQIRPGGVYSAGLIHFTLNEQLQKLKNTGFWVDAMKLQAMLEPRQGDEPAWIMKEAVIDIRKP